MASVQRSWSARFKRLGWNLAIIIAFWVVARVLVAVSYAAVDHWAFRQVSLLVVSAGCLVLALRSGARIAAFVMAVNVAYCVSYLCIHVIFGIQAAQGGEAHWSTLGAAVAGTGIGSLLLLRGGGSSSPVTTTRAT